MTKKTYSRTQTCWLVILRVLIGWHFMYEGVAKLCTSGWSSEAYLLDSRGLFSELFFGIANNPSLLAIADFLNMWGLLIIGACLILGLFSKYAALGAIALLSLYFLSHPSFIGASYMMPTEGTYLWVDKNLIEIAALAVLICLPTSHIIGLDRLFVKDSNL